MKMERAKGTKPKGSKLKALLVLAIIVVAAVAGAYYWETRPMLEFTMSVYPPFFHVGVREGKVVNVSITRSPGFTGQVQVSVSNPPTWVATAPRTITGSQSNASIPVIAKYNAPFGSVELTILATSPGALDQYGHVEMKVVTVQRYTSRNGNATIYDTTKGLDAATKQALLHYANGTLTFSHETPLLRNLTRDDVFVAGPSPPVAPLGFFRLVLSVTQQNETVIVQTTQASILDAVQEIHVHTSGGNSTGGSAGSLGATCLVCVGSSLTIIPETTLTPPGLPLNWGAIKADASISIGAIIDYGLDVSLAWPSWTQIVQAGVCFAESGGNLIAAVACGIAQVDDAHFVLQANGDAEADITGTAGAVNAGPVDLIPAEDCSSLGVPDSIGSCISPIPLFSIGPVGINLGVGLRFVGGATGQLATNMYVKVARPLQVGVGPEYSNGQFSLLTLPFPSIPTTEDATLGGSGGNNDVKLYAGPEITVAVDGGAGPVNLAVGLSAGLHAFLEFLSQIPHNPVWWVQGGLEGCIGASASAFLMGTWNSPYACAPLLSGTIFQQNPNNNPIPSAAPVLTIPNQDMTIDLTNPNFFSYASTDWLGQIPQDPQMAPSMTCLWYTDLGQMGTTQAVSTRLSWPAYQCQGPPQVDLPVNQIVTQDITHLTVYFIAEDSYGAKSSPSNSVTLQVLLPTPMLQILCIASPISSTCGPPTAATITQNQPFAVVGEASITMVGRVNDFCNTAPQRLQWSIDYAALGNNPYGCSAQLTITTTGQHMILFFLLTPDLSNMATDSNGNFYIASVTVNVQAQPSLPTQPITPPQGGLRVMITSPSSPTQYSGSAGVTPSSGPIYLTGVDLTPGTSPFTFTWYAQYSSQTVTIATTGPSNLVMSTYTWNVCNTFYNYQGMASVYLKATDAANHEGTAGPVYVSFNCEVAQAFPPFGAAVVSLLTVLFAATGDQFIVKVRNAPWFRGVGFRSH